MSGRTDLDTRLADLGAHLEFPPTPALTPSVRARLRAPAPRPAWWRRRLAAAMAAAALLAAAVLGVPPLRTTVAHWLGIRGVEIVPVQTLPPVPTRTPGPPGESLDLGIPFTLQQAQARFGFTPLLPAELGRPDAVWGRDELGGIVTLVYLPRPGLPESGQTEVGALVTEFRASVDSRFFQKFAGPQTQILPVTVEGEQGYWLGGAPTVLGYHLPGGGDTAEVLRLAGPTLVFQHGALSVRIEAAIAEADALRIATSMS